MKKKTIMIIGAAEEHCLGIRAAHELGLNVFVTDGNPDSPGFSEAEAFSVASTYDPEATFKVAMDYVENGGRVDGVMALASDVPYTVAYVAEKLNLAGVGVESALNATEKVRMKMCFKEKKIPIPLFQEVSNKEHLIEVSEEFGLPLIVKPVDSRGARGVQLIKNEDQLHSAYANACEFSPTGRVLVEQYLSGDQISTEGIMLDGEAYIPAIFDRNYEYLERYSPFIVENGGEMPSQYSEDYSDEIHKIMKDAALALGIRTGIIKGDLVIHDGKVKVIEIAARLSGGFFGSVATPVSCGVDIVKTNIKLSLGEKITPKDLEHKFEKAAAIRFSFPHPGRVRNVSGLERVQQDPSCRYAHVFVKPGDYIAPITNHPGRPAVVVAVGHSLNEASSNARRLINTLVWDIDRV